MRVVTELFSILRKVSQCARVLVQREISKLMSRCEPL